MSETKSAWASMSTVAEMLVTSVDVSKIHFSVTKHENKPAELHCRCHGLLGMTKTEVETLASELNDAMAPVLKRYEATLQKKAANQLMRFL